MPHPKPFSLPTLKEARKAALAFYATIKHVSCPGFGGERVVFSRQGFDHIAYLQRRTTGEIIARLSLLVYAPRVLSDDTPTVTKRVQEERTLGGVISVSYWCFEHTCDSVPIKVIVRQVDGRAKQFFSVMKAYENKATPGTEIAL